MKRSITPFAVCLVMLALAVIVAGAKARTLHVAPVSSLSNNLDCEGNACSRVTLTFDEAKQQYKAQTHSDRLVRVEVSNLAGGNWILVHAGKDAYLPMKSIVGTYRAYYE